jgi:hypothetical protein
VKCHIHRDKETGESFLIPGDCTLWSYSHHQGSMTDRQFIKEYCTCKPETYHQYEKELFNKKQQELKKEIDFLQNEVASLREHIEYIYHRWPYIAKRSKNHKL